ncbi:MAG TPA: acetate kinase [Bacteroidales bacterium]|nr:acetate kinase [Bacteroidales bacterium]HRZ48027.1 acetate kinase [Bacteroidales bacterium]
MKILVLNCGSSSIKYQLIDMSHEADLLAKGIVERVGMKCAELSHSAKNRDKFNMVKDIPDHQTGINLILDILVHPAQGVIKSKDEITAVGHRVAHGGENFKASVRITNRVKQDIEKCIELAPLHNPANLKGILSIDAILPDVPQVAVFDTSFHQTMPKHAYLYGIPYEYYEKYNIRRYGFHGTSHKFVAQKGCDLLGKNWEDLKIITCHLGNGASITAIDRGQSVETSMGFTPIEGLLMGTRAGDLDIGVVLYLMEKENLDYKEINNILNKKSGVLGISGLSFDMRDIDKAISEGNERAEIAQDMYCHRVKKYIGAYAAVMDGIDLLIFTGGIGENDILVREKVTKGLSFLGIDLDVEKNNGLRGKDMVISKPESRTTAMVVTTNEELVIARDTLSIISKAM